jgi:cytochrome c551/c552
LFFNNHKRGSGVRSKRLSIIVGVVGLIAMIGIACTSDVSEATRVPTPQFDPTPAGEAAPVPTQPPAAATAAPANGGSAGDAGNGESVFQSNGCSGCHSTDDNTLVGPGLKGLSGRAGDSVAGVSADEYIAASVTDPGSFVVDGFTNLMPDIFGSMAESDLQDLVAYLNTLN